MCGLYSGMSLHSMYLTSGGQGLLLQNNNPDTDGSDAITHFAQSSRVKSPLNPGYAIGQLQLSRHPQTGSSAPFL